MYGSVSGVSFELDANQCHTHEHMLKREVLVVYQDRFHVPIRSLVSDQLLLVEPQSVPTRGRCIAAWHMLLSHHLMQSSHHMNAYVLHQLRTGAKPVEDHCPYNRFVCM